LHLENQWSRSGSNRPRGRGTPSANGYS